MITIKDVVLFKKATLPKDATKPIAPKAPPLYLERPPPDVFSPLEEYDSKRPWKGKSIYGPEAKKFFGVSKHRTLDERFQQSVLRGGGYNPYDYGKGGSSDPKPHFDKKIRDINSKRFPKPAFPNKGFLKRIRYNISRWDDPVVETGTGRYDEDKNLRFNVLQPNGEKNKYFDFVYDDINGKHRYVPTEEGKEHLKNRVRLNEKRVVPPQYYERPELKERLKLLEKWSPNFKRTYLTPLTDKEQGELKEKNRQGYSAEEVSGIMREQYIEQYKRRMEEERQRIENEIKLEKARIPLRPHMY